MRTRSLVISTVAAAFMMATQALAAAPVVVVNVQRILQESSAAKSITEQLKKRSASFKDQLTKKEEELKRVDQDLAKQRGSISPEEFEKKKAEFRKRVTDTQQDVQQKRAALDRGYTKAIGEIQKQVATIVADLAKERGFDVAVSTSDLLYAKPETDITEEVIKRLNAALPDVKVVVDESAAAKAPAQPKGN